MKDKKVLFICLGNINRSQMAEGFYNFFTHSKNASSAGLNPTTSLEFDNPAMETIEVMKEVGIDVSKQEVKYLTEDMVKEADEIYVLTNQIQYPSYLEDCGKMTYWEVEDPYLSDLDNFRKIRDLIKEKVLSVIDHQKMKG